MVEYQDFIQNKVRFDHGDGLTCSEADVNPILKPHQRDMVWRSLNLTRSGRI